MKHSEAITHLPALADGSLPQRLAGAVASHAKACGECRDWFAAYGVLAELAREASDYLGEDGHPESAVLAYCATRPEEVFEPDRADLMAHLASCSRCAGELELLKAAVASARPSFVGAHEEVRSPVRLGSHWRSAVAAAVVLAALFPVLWWFGAGAPPEEGGLHQIAAETAAPPDLEARVADRLFGVDLQGESTVEAEQSLTITNVKVHDGASVTIRSGGRVAFGDGFVVGSGTRVSVEGRSAADIAPGQSGLPKRLDRG